LGSDGEKRSVLGILLLGTFPETSRKADSASCCGDPVRNANWDQGETAVKDETKNRRRGMTSVIHCRRFSQVLWHLFISEEARERMRSYRSGGLLSMNRRQTARAAGRRVWTKARNDGWGLGWFPPAAFRQPTTTTRSMRVAVCSLFLMAMLLMGESVPPPQRRKKAVALDLDGTLLNREHRVSQRSRSCGSCANWAYK